MNNVATIEKIRQALRALRNSIESHGEDGRKYNLMMGISFAPAKGLSADGLIEAVNNNRKVSPDLVYGMQAGLKQDPHLDIDKAAAIASLDAFEASLSALPQDLGAGMTLEFTVSNDHEKAIIEQAQKAINQIQTVSSEDIAKVAASKS